MKDVLVYGLKNMHGGLENYLLTMQSMLCKDFSFVYFVEECDCIHKEYIETKNGKILYLPERHKITQYIKTCIQYLKEYKKKTRTLYVNINDISFDIIIIIIGLFYGYKVIVHSHNAMMEPIAKLKYRIRHNVLEHIGKILLYSSKVERLAVSERSARYLFKSKEYSRVTPGILTKKFVFDMETRISLKKELKIEEKHVVGFVGRIEKIKNPLFVLSVFEELLKINKDVCMIFVGDGVLLDSLKKKAQEIGIIDKVRFIGAVDNVNEYLSAIDCLLAPSISEGLGLAVLEAQAAGAIVLCSSGRFPEEVKQTNLLKFVSLDNSAKQWAEICNTLILDYTVVDREKWNRIICESDFEISVASDKLKKILSNA